MRVQSEGAGGDVVILTGCLGKEFKQAGVADQVGLRQLVGNGVDVVVGSDRNGDLLRFLAEGHHFCAADPQNTAQRNTDRHDQRQPNHSGKYTGDTEKTFTVGLLGSTLGRFDRLFGRRRRSCRLLLKSLLHHIQRQLRGDGRFDLWRDGLLAVLFCQDLFHFRIVGLRCENGHSTVVLDLGHDHFQLQIGGGSRVRLFFGRFFYLGDLIRLKQVFQPARILRAQSLFGVLSSRLQTAVLVFIFVVHS